ncbi:serine/threonine-protein kinase [Streptomyces sp. NPDC002889]|uniref:serine/threonine-protein kinase n=1 Tax=Streptomyces sp. NPDC002889 TaxID=3364669 RepID=UPI003677B837
MALGGQPDRVIGARYRLINRLGSGGFGQVWKAYDETLHVDVAIKEVRLPSTVSETERAERLVRAAREARKAAALRDHPNIVAVHDVVIEDEVSWTVMQLVVGHSLEDQLNTRGPLSTDDAGKIATALLKALDAAHAAGIVHRDVKPANVMLADNGEVLITDFGIAVHQADTALTATGLVIGSAEYIAPERVEGKDGQPASDLFSLGRLAVPARHPGRDADGCAGLPAPAAAARRPSRATDHQAAGQGPGQAPDHRRGTGLD